MRNENLLNKMVIINDGFEKRLGVIKEENVNEWVNDLVIKVKGGSDISHAKKNIKEEGGLGVGVKLASKQDLELMLLRDF